MKKITAVIAILALSAAVLAAGCGNDDYAIERRYYLIQKQVALIFKNPEVAPQKELDRSIGALRDFIKKYPKKNLAIEAEFTIARLYIVKKEYGKAQAQLTGMLAKHKTSEVICSEILFLMGNSYEIQDQWDSANAQYQKLIRQYPLTLRGLSTPIYVAQHYKIKYLPDMMGVSYKEAISHYQALIKNHPDLSPKLIYTIHQLIAQSYAEIKDWEGAVNTLNSILTIHNAKPGLDGIMFSMAGIYGQKLNNKAKAIEILEALVTGYPKSRFVNPAKDLIKRLSEKTQ